MGLHTAIRKTSWTLLILLSALSVTPHTTAAASYYVSTTGSDSNPGTLSLPWKTVQMAAKSLKPGDIAFLRGGTFTENRIAFAQSGTASAPITIAAYPDETPVINGGASFPVNSSIPVFEIQGVAYITLSKLTIRGGAVSNIRIAYDKPATYITIRQCDLKEFLFADNSANIYINNSGADNILIEQNKIHDGLGIPLTLNNAAGIILFHAKTVTIRGNVIFNTNNGIYYKHSTDDGAITTIENNLIFNQTAGGSGRGLKLSRSDMQIRNNIIHTSDIGIEIFEESATCPNLVSARNSILHNTLVDIRVGIILARSSRCEGAVDTIIRDNVIYNFTNTEMRGGSIWAYYSGSDGSRTTFDHNLVFSPTISRPIRLITQYYTPTDYPASILGSRSSNLNVAPQFQDYSGKNYALTPGSPGTNAASDGKDMGADVLKVGLLSQSSPITNLRVTTVSSR